MARIIPEELRDAPFSERSVHAVLCQLPDPWIVVSDIPIGAFGRPKPGIEQIDFLLIHPRRGLAVVEVKGGFISIEEGQWFTLPRDGTEPRPLRRSPMEQARIQRFELQQFLWKHVHVKDDAMAHAIVLPDCAAPGRLGPDEPPELVIDMNALAKPQEAIDTVMRKWKTSLRLSERDTERIIRLLKPTMKLTVVLASRTALTEREIDRETRRQVHFSESQVHAYRELLRKERTVILGEAGTGKTVLAIERARTLARTGARTLLLCHRAAVLSGIRTALGDEAGGTFELDSEDLLSVTHWTGLNRALSGRGSVLPRPTAGDLPEAMLAAADRLGVRYDAIVVDEGQEFTSGQLEGLTWLLDDPEHGPLYVFADPFQHSGLFSASHQLDRAGLRGAYDWSIPFEVPVVTLTDNVRNTRPIAELAAAFVLEGRSSSSVDGQAPEIHRVPRLRAVIDKGLGVVHRLLEDEGFRPNQLLVVLVGVETDAFAKAATRNGLDVVAVSELARFPLTPADLRVAYGSPDLVQGLEAEVVVVLNWRDGPMYVGDVRDLYVALSRARSHLIVVSNRDEAELSAAAKVAFANPDLGREADQEDEASE